MENNVLIIAGMHRSGTSLITQWLHRCGLHVGDELLGKGIGNDDGHFEDLAFYNFHLKALRSRNLPESGFIETPSPSLTEKEKEQLRVIIDKRNRTATDWGWKDPRTCLYLPDYEQLLPSANYMVIYRDFQSTVSSLIVRTHKVIHRYDHTPPNSLWAKWKASRRKKKEMDELCRENASAFVKVWILYNQEILRFVQTISPERFIIVRYESLVADDRKVFGKLRNQWNLALDHISFLDIYKPSLISQSVNIRRYVDERLYQEAVKVEQDLQSIQFA